MADFCLACHTQLFGKGECGLAALVTEEEWSRGYAGAAFCEGCGSILVDPEGNCISEYCLRAGQPGHGVEQSGPTLPPEMLVPPQQFAVGQRVRVSDGHEFASAVGTIRTEGPQSPRVVITRTPDGPKVYFLYMVQFDKPQNSVADAELDSAFLRAI
jgi:hypothetical protein